MKNENQAMLEYLYIFYNILSILLFSGGIYFIVKNYIQPNIGIGHIIFGVCLIIIFIKVICINVMEI